MDFEQARFNMIEQQIRPWDVLDPKILSLLFHVKREDFVGQQQKSLAFTDVELPLSNGSFMLQPKQEARMVQDLEIQPQDKILEIGTGTAYVTALLANLGQHVYSVEIDEGMLVNARQSLKKAGIKNVTLFQANGITGLKKHAPYDVIFVGGSVPVVPESLKNQLSHGGRMILAVGDLPVMHLCLIQRLNETGNLFTPREI